jgi:hypothetical protein
VATLLLVLGPGSPNTYGNTFLVLTKEPASQVEAPSVLLQNGTAGVSTIYANDTSAKASAPAAQTLYAHQEQTSLGATSCYLLKLNSADSAGTIIEAEAETTGRKLMGYWVFQLTGLSSVPASTWTIYYRANKTNSAVEAHCDVNILIRMSNGTIRQTIATDVANSNGVTTAWTTLSATYSWAAYTVVNQTDYLEIDFYVEVTAKRNNEHVHLRVDDNTLAAINQTRVADVLHPRSFDYVLRVNNTVAASWQIRLRKYADTSISRLENCTIYLHNSTDGNSNQLVVEAGVFENDTGAWYDVGSLETIYIAMAVEANSTGTSNIYAFLEIRFLGSSTYLQYIIAFEIT